MFVKKSCPDPTKPKELLAHYFQQFYKWILIYYRDSLRDLSGKKRKKKFGALLHFKDSGKGKVAFVLANGPSIKKLDAHKIQAFKSSQNADIFCVNFFINSEFAETTEVDYWVISDPRSFDLTIEESAQAFQASKTLVRKALFTSNIYSSKIKGITATPVIEFNDIETSNIFSNNIDPRFPRSYLSMSAYKALALAVYANYDKIYICGFDNTYVRNLGCDRLNRIYRTNEHFDAKAYPNTNPIQLLNYQHRTVADELLAYTRLFNDLKKFPSHKVVNLDVDSLTDAFEKDDSLDFFKNS